MNKLPLLKTFLWRFDLKTGVVFVGIAEIFMSSALAIHSLFNLANLSSIPGNYWHHLILSSLELGYGLVQFLCAVVLLAAVSKAKFELIHLWFYTHILFIIFVTMEGLLLALLDTLFALLIVLLNLAMFGYFMVIVSSYYRLLMSEDRVCTG